MRKIQKLLEELDKLKSVYRRTYICDGSRNENSAEHSWHLAMALLAFRDVMPQNVDMNHAVRMALFHDVCEIGTGDVSVFDPGRSEKTAEEGRFIASFAVRFDDFGRIAADFWSEYEDQKTPESRWVKAADRILPFILNLAGEGKAWKEQNISQSQLLAVNADLRDLSPELYAWMEAETEKAVRRGWLRDA